MRETIEEKLEREKITKEIPLTPEETARVLIELYDFGIGIEYAKKPYEESLPHRI